MGDCKVMIYNYFVLALISCQIWLSLCSIFCNLYFMWDFYCKGCVWQRVWRLKAIEEQRSFRG